MLGVENKLMRNWSNFKAVLTCFLGCITELDTINLLGDGNLKLSLIFTIQVGAITLYHLNIRSISQSPHTLSVEK